MSKLVNKESIIKTTLKALDDGEGTSLMDRI